MIIFVNGTLNAGKSTVSRLLAQRIPRPAVVEVDSLHAFIEWVDIDEAVPLNLKNAAAIIRNFATEGFNVIVPCPLSAADHAFLLAQLEGLGLKIYVFTLRPTLEKTQTSTAQRLLSDWKKRRMEHHHAIGLTDPAFGVVIDNTNQTPDQTAAAILIAVGHGDKS